MTDLTYRGLSGDDFDALHGVVSHWSVTRQLGGWPWPPDVDFTANRCKPYTGEGFVWAVCQNDRVIGSIAVTRGGIGYMFDPSVRGQGIATHAARDAIAHAFATTGRNHLTGSTWHDNPASARVLQKLGFIHWQTRYISAFARGLPTLSYEHRLTRTAWDRLSHAAQ